MFAFLSNPMNRHVLLLCVLILTAAAYADCNGYTDSFKARVLDAKLRPVPGAAVSVTYDRGGTFGDQYFTTPVRYTGQDGTVQMDIYSQETNTRPVDCMISINGSAGGSERTADITANQHGPIVDIMMDDVYPLRFYVKDQNDVPISGAFVTIGNTTNRTGNDGSLMLYLKVDDYGYFMNYLDASQAGSITIADDTEFLIRLKYYQVSVDVVDDDGNPLPASLSIFNSTFELPNGHFENNRTFGQEIPYTVEYKGVEISGTITPEKTPAEKVVYDLHSPTISDVKAEALNELPRLIITVADVGKYPSGVDLTSVTVTYRMEPSDATAPWDKAVTFSTGRNQITAEFPELPKNRIVRFKIDIKDKAGNRAEVEGKFTTYSSQAANNTNNTINQTNPQDNQQTAQGIPLLYMLGGGIIVVFVIYYAFRIKSRGGNGS